MGAVFALVVHLTPSFRSPHGDFPASYFVLLLAVYALHQVALYGMFVAMMAFNAKVSDPRIGGTYMTLLNTVANLGGDNRPLSATFFLIGVATRNFWAPEPTGHENQVGAKLN